MRKRKEIIAQNEVSRMETFLLGGYDQKVLIEGRKKDLPVVIFLHGGPGTPIPFNAGCRGMFPEFTDKFIMVYWDQLGCGINHCHLDENLKISNFVDMTADLISEIKALFPQNPLYLYGTSWGSVLCARALEAAAGKVDGILTSGQITHNLFFNSHVTEALEHSKIPESKLEQFRSIEPRMLCAEDLQFLQKCLQKYTDGYTNSKGKKPPVGAVILKMLSSPDYKLKDLKAVVMNGYSENRELMESLFKELVSLDLREALSHTPIPYRIIQGDTDIVATTDYVKETVEAAGNPMLTCRIVKNCGHFPSPEAMDLVLESLTELTAAE